MTWALTERGLVVTVAPSVAMGIVQNARRARRRIITEATMDQLPGDQHWRRVVNEVAVKHNVPASYIVGRKQFGLLCKARAECYYRLRNEVKVGGRQVSWQRIGMWLGGRDHSTCQQMAKRHVKRIGPAI